MAFKEAKTGRWRVQIRRAGYGSVSRSFATKKAADQFERDELERIEALKRSGGLAARGIMFGELVDAYINNGFDHGATKVGRLRLWIDILGSSTPILDISTPVVARGLDTLASTPALRFDGVGKVTASNKMRSPATINR